MKMVLKIGENHKVIPRYHLPLVGRHFVFGLVTAPFRTIPERGMGLGRECFSLLMFSCGLRLFKLKTEGQTIRKENLIETLQNSNQILANPWLA